MNDVRLPIETVREGDKITKTCVEDVYKIVNRVQNAMDKAYNESVEILDSINKEYYPENDPDYCYNGELIIGKGTSQPCDDDVFDEKIGIDIAFMKAKLNANLKKWKILDRIVNKWIKAIATVDDDLYKIEAYIRKDLNGIRKYNPDYLIGLFDENFEEE